ncbi:MAG: HAD family hydrolase [Phycisphaerales bacterium]
MLLLFDIDGTLLHTSGVGTRAMVAAGRSVFGPSFSAEGVEFAGRLDPLIIGEMLERSGVCATAEQMSVFTERYTRELGDSLARANAAPAPGVIRLLDALAQEAATLAVLTGNIATAGRMKLSACGIDPDRFALHVWGDESPRTPPRRADLVEVAMARFGAMTGSMPGPSGVVVIGDTPGDVECGKAHGCRVLAVATGKFSVEQLRACGPDLTLPTLERTDEVIGWLLSRK